MCRMISLEQLRQKLVEACQAAGGQAAYGRLIGYDSDRINAACRGKRAVPAYVAQCLGYNIISVAAPRK